MKKITLSDITTPLRSYGEKLKNVTNNFQDSLFKYWKEREFLHIAISLTQSDDGKIQGDIPSLSFRFMSRNRFVLADKTLYSEIEFFTIVEDEAISLLKCYLNFNGELTFHSVTSDQLFNTEYDRNVEPTVINEIVSAAYEKKLISV